MEIKEMLMNFAVKQKGVQMDDLISRQAAIDALSCENPTETYIDYDDAVKAIRRLHSAEPETHEERTETHECDLISRQEYESRIKPYDTEDSMDKALYNFAHNILMCCQSAEPELIRCKDCKWKQGAECVRFAEIRPFPNDFCSRGERRTDG